MDQVAEGARRGRRSGGDRRSPAFAAFLVFLAAVALTGGSSRGDSFAQLLVRSASVLLVGGLLLTPVRPSARGVRAPLAILAALAALIAAQLAPLPPSVWAALPGRGLYREVAAALGAAQPWRPLSLAPDRTWNALLSLVPPAAAAIGLCFLRREERAGLLPALLVLVGASAVLGIAQMSGAAPALFQPYATNDPTAAAGLFANRNHNALLLALGLPPLALWASADGGRDGRGRARARARAPLALGLGALLVIAIPATGSRAGLAVGGLALLVALGMAARPMARALGRMGGGARLLALGGGLGAAGALLALALTSDRAASVQRFFGLDASEDLRGRVLPTLLAMAERFFPVGVGLGAFDPVYRRFQPFELLSFTYLNQAHNDVLQLVIEGGLAGALLLGGVGLWWSWRTVVLWRAPASAPFVRIGRVASALLFLVLPASLVDYPLRTPLMMVVGVVLASWLQLYDPRLRGGGRAG